jgi:hypothetical protein
LKVENQNLLKAKDIVEIWKYIISNQFKHCYCYERLILIIVWKKLRNDLKLYCKESNLYLLIQIENMLS